MAWGVCEGGEVIWGVWGHDLLLFIYLFIFKFFFSGSINQRTNWIKFPGGKSSTQIRF